MPLENFESPRTTFKDTEKALSDLRYSVERVSYHVAHRIDEYDPRHHPRIAQILIKMGRGGPLAVNLEKFQGLDHVKIADQLIREGYGYYVASHLNKFKGIDRTTTIQKIRDVEPAVRVDNKFTPMEGFMEYLKHPQNVDRQKAVEDLIRKDGLGDWIASHFDFVDAYKPFDQNGVVKALIDADNEEDLINNMNQFDDLSSQQIAVMLIGAGKGQYVSQFEDQLGVLDGENEEEISPWLNNEKKDKATA